MTAARLADAHLHIFSRGFPGEKIRPILGGGLEIDAYEALRGRHDIAAGLIIGYEGDGIDPDNNRHIRELAGTRPWMATAAFVDPRSDVSPERVTTLLDDGHVGIVIYAPHREAAEAIAAWSPATWEALDARGAIVSLNARPPATATLHPLVSRYGACRFLFSHLGLPGRHAAPPSQAEAAERIASLLALATSDNVMVKISGLYAVSDPDHAYPHEAAAPFISVILDRFGPSRCLWASDFSPALEFLSFPQTIDIPALADLSPDERDQVMGANLLGLLRSAGWSGDAP